MKQTLYKYLLLAVTLLCLCSCNNDKRVVKKFVKRMNAREVNAASKYVYPADHAALYFFNEEVYSKSPNTFFTIKERQKSIIDGQRCVIVKLECINTSRFFQNYMINLGLLNNNIIVDTIYIRQTDKRKCISFDWAKIKGENLKLAAMPKEARGIVNIHSGMSENHEIINKLNENQKIVIDEYSDHPEWVKCFAINHQCHIVEGYINNKYIESEDILFFSLGIFDSLGVILAMVILVVLGIPVFYLRSIVSAFSNLPVQGVVLCVGLILGLLYVIYQLLENILFELFLINLPY